MSAFLEKMDRFVIARGIITRILDNDYEYRVVKQGFERSLPGFVGLIEGVLFISDSVPVEYRDYIFWHEVKCVIHCNRKGCAKTVEEELKRVPDRIRQGYIEYRCGFFEALIEFYSSNPPAFYQEIVESHQYLRGLIAH